MAVYWDVSLLVKQGMKEVPRYLVWSDCCEVRCGIAVSFEMKLLHHFKVLDAKVLDAISSMGGMFKVAVFDCHKACSQLLLAISIALYSVM